MIFKEFGLPVEMGRVVNLSINCGLKESTKNEIFRQDLKLYHA